MTGWRSPNWGLSQPFAQSDNDAKKGEWVSAHLLTSSEQALFEAGADAMLKEIRAMGFRATSIRDLKAPHSETITIPTLERMKQLKEIQGHWVFIPDDNKENSNERN